MIIFERVKNTIAGGTVREYGVKGGQTLKWDKEVELVNLRMTNNLRNITIRQTLMGEGILMVSNENLKKESKYFSYNSYSKTNFKNGVVKVVLLLGSCLSVRNQVKNGGKKY